MYIESFYARVYSSEFNKDENIKIPDYAEHEYHKLAVNLLKLRNCQSLCQEQEKIPRYDSEEFDKTKFLEEFKKISKPNLENCLNHKRRKTFQTVPSGTAGP